MKKTIVCFGDSNTHGYCSETGGRLNDSQRYPCLLGKYLGNSYFVIEEGLSGRTTVFEDPLFEGLNGYDAIFQCLMSHEPIHLLIIMLGTNDTKERFHVNAENIAKGLEKLILKAQSIKNAWHNATPNILILAPYPIDQRYATTFVANEMGKDCAFKSESLAYYYKNVAGSTGCHFFDTKNIKGMEVHPNDYMHLTANSHHLLAQELATIITSLQL